MSVFRVRPPEPTDLIIEAESVDDALHKYALAINEIGVECYMLVAVTGESAKAFQPKSGIDVVGALPDNLIKKA